jgi:hypothetical protein
MAIRKSVIMMTNTGTRWNVIGEPIRADAYYGYTDGIHTVQVIYQNFVGGFGLQGTLALKPEPDDWFWIRLNPNGDVNTPFIPFPMGYNSTNNTAPCDPTGANGGDTGSLATTFIGNFVFLRAVLSRDYIQPQVPPVQAQWETWQWGQIDKVMLSL